MIIVPCAECDTCTLENLVSKVVAYAHDVAIAVRGKYPSTLRDILQGNLYTLSRRAGENGLDVSSAKAELVLFTRKYKIPIVDPTILKGSEIKLVATYLGIILDSELNSWR